MDRRRDRSYQNFHDAYRGFKKGQQVDFSCDGGRTWTKDPFAKLILGIRVEDAALDDAVFRERPNPRTRCEEIVMAEFHCSQVAPRKSTEACNRVVHEVLAEVRKIGTGHAYRGAVDLCLNAIEKNFCGGVEPPQGSED